MSLLLYAKVYGEKDLLNGEYTTGVFAAMLWVKFNNYSNAYNAWIFLGGPVGAIWIEDLHIVLDDKKILSLAKMKIMFEAETLVNEFPATVSRAGTIFVSDMDLDWRPFVEGWIRKQPSNQQVALRALFTKYMGASNPADPGLCIDWLSNNATQDKITFRVGVTHFLCDIYFLAMLLRAGGQIKRDNPTTALETYLLHLYRSLCVTNPYKMAAQDTPLVLSLLADLFPRYILMSCLIV